MGLGPDNSPVRVTVRSRRQAMDWSLVLVSQGIGTTIQHEPGGAGWYLEVSAQDGQKAFQTLRQYQIENRGRSWRHAVPWPEADFDWASLIWAAILAGCFWLGRVNPAFKAAGIMDSSAVARGEWWRVFTAIMLHADLSHLISNLSIGVVLFGFVMGRFGGGTGLLATLLAGAAGNALSLALNPKPFYGLGASGMIMAALGMLSAQTLCWTGPAQGTWSRRLVGLGAGIMLFALYAVSPGTDLAAHLGGFVMGLIFGAVLVFVPPKLLHSHGTNLVTGLIFCCGIAAVWILALTK
jgi:rhomboid protease GluP